MRKEFYRSRGCKEIYFANNKGKNLEKFFNNWIKKYQTKSLILKRLNKKITTWNETYKDIHMTINKN